MSAEATPGALAHGDKPPLTIEAALRRADRLLTPCSESPRLDAEILLGKVLGLSRSGLISHGTDALAVEHENDYANLLARRQRGAPVAYLTGTREFWSLPLIVTPAVLVPRPETEVLVELALELLPPGAAGTVLDLGTGSGAIALAIASERPQSRITAVDLSATALEVARLNSRNLKISNIDWRLGSWFDAVPGERFNLIASNPPYVAAGDPALQTLAAEPEAALSSGPTGLEALAAIAAGASRHLQPKGWLVLEHGSGQATEVAHLLEQHGFTRVRSHLDLSGRPRVMLGTLNNQP